MKSRTAKLTAAAAIAIVVVVGGLPFWPGDSDAGKWWLGPPAAWGQEILAQLDAVKAVTWREQFVSVWPDGSESISRNWSILYISNDSYRRDMYDRDVLLETQWYVPDGDGTRQHSVRFDLKSYFTHTGPGGFGNYDPIDRMRFYVKLIDEADMLLGEDTIDGIPCVGFEISASKYGKNPEDWIDCIWFDVETKLPVRIEERRPVTNRPWRTRTTIKSEFDYYPNLPADTFVPETPEGYIHAHPDETNNEASQTISTTVKIKPADSDESKEPAQMVGTWFFDNPHGDDEQMAIFPDGRVVVLYSNGHKDQVNIVDGSIELAEFNNAKCRMTIQEDGSLVQYFDLYADSKRWNRIAPEPHTNLLRALSSRSLAAPSED